MHISTIFLKELIPKHVKLSQILKFDGKSYKLSIKPNCYNMRFNRANKLIWVNKNLSITIRPYIKKIYLHNAILSRTPLYKIITSTRLVNAYTLRGIWSYHKTITKRQGLVSEYM